MRQEAVVVVVPFRHNFLMKVGEKPPLKIEAPHVQGLFLLVVNLKIRL